MARAFSYFVVTTTSAALGLSPPYDDLTSLRFDGCRRLLGPGPWSHLLASHVAVVGLGGVGSWCVEALARSGIGRLTLVDLDEVCVSNCNRQLCALTSTVGTPKAHALMSRCFDINPNLQLRPVLDFVDKHNVHDLLRLDDDAPDVVVDAIDSVDDKAALVDACCQRAIPLVCVGAAGGRTDPTRVRLGAGLTHCAGDPLLRAVRKRLRRSAQCATAVFSDEKATRIPDDALKRTGCDQAFGTAAYVTGAFGLAAAKAAIDHLLVPPPFEEEDCPCSDFSGS